MAGGILRLMAMRLSLPSTAIERHVSLGEAFAAPLWTASDRQLVMNTSIGPSLGHSSPQESIAYPTQRCRVKYLGIFWAKEGAAGTGLSIGYLHINGRLGGRH